MVWHESQELIGFHINKILEAGSSSPETINVAIQSEIVETMASLFMPALITITLIIILIFIAISYLTKPLRELVTNVESKTPYNLTPLNITPPLYEVSVVEKSINLLLQRQEHGLEHERRFTTDVAHELRTPLAGIRLNLELMIESGTPQVQFLVARVDQMMISIEQLLQLARAGQRFLNGNEKYFDMVNEVITPLRMEWEDSSNTEKCIEITWQIPEKLDVKGDSGLLYLLLRNLLDNAQAYACDGKYVTATLSPKNNQVVLDVIDQGPGVAEDKIELLTHRFTRLDQTKKGHGLGLNIVSRIIAAHHSTLNIKNRTDHSGLHITVQLPLLS